MNYRIVPMDKGHLKAVHRLEVANFSAPWSMAMLETELYNDLASYLVAEGEDGTVLGYAGVHVVLDEGHITNVCVGETFRRQGVGRELLKVYLRYGDAHLATLDLEVRQSNEAAVKLYEGLGFEIAGRRPNYYTEPSEDGYIMRKLWDRGTEA